MSTPKLKPCTSGLRHAWTWQRNTMTRRVNSGPHGTTVHISGRGLYRCCDCGQTKLGDMRAEVQA